MSGILQSRFIVNALPALPAFPSANQIYNNTGITWNTDLGIPVTLTTGQTDLLGGSQAVKLAYSGSNTTAAFATDQNINTTLSSGKIAVSVYAKSLGGTAPYMRMCLFAWTGSLDYGCMFNLSGGTVGSYRSGGGTEGPATIEAAGSGWYLCTLQITASPPDGVYNIQLGPYSGDATNFDTMPSSGTAGDGILVWRLQAHDGDPPSL